DNARADRFEDAAQGCSPELGLVIMLYSIVRIIPPEGTGRIVRVPPAIGLESRKPGIIGKRHRILIELHRSPKFHIVASSITFLRHAVGPKHAAPMSFGFGT